MPEQDINLKLDAILRIVSLLTPKEFSLKKLSDSLGVKPNTLNYHLSVNFELGVDYFQAEKKGSKIYIPFATAVKVQEYYSQKGSKNGK